MTACSVASPPALEQRQHLCCTHDTWSITALPQCTPFAAVAAAALLLQIAVNERCEALAAVLPALPPSAAWQLYTAIPGLLTLMTLSVAQRLHGLAYATSLPLPQLLQQLLAFRRLAFVHPVTVESRLGLLARVARLDRRRAVLLMAQQPQLWLMDSRQLGPR